jgi:hypothetical protein
VHFALKTKEMKKILLLLTVFSGLKTTAQTFDTKPLKLHHAEPLFTDLIRDLGARKGEHELNIGIGVNDEKTYYSYTGFAEYEFAIANRLGLEVEVPFEVNTAAPRYYKTAVPGNRVEGIKLATQYTFLVSKKWQTSMAVGYIQEMEFSPFQEPKATLFSGTRYNPIFISATRLTPNIHMLLYTGPEVEQDFATGHATTTMAVNANLHYVFANGNFVGLETNINFSAGKPDIVLRPQFKVAFSKSVSVGVLAGIPASHYNHGLSAMTRMIWVP